MVRAKRLEADRAQPIILTVALAPDEVFVKINGKTHYLWRAVDHEGEVLEVFVTKRRDRKAAYCVLCLSTASTVRSPLRRRYPQRQFI